MTFHALKQEKNKLAIRVTHLEGELDKEQARKKKVEKDLDDSDKLLTKAKRKISKLNKRMFDIKTTAIANCKKFVEFDHKKGKTINKAIKNII